jgi:hypothetical protein
MTETLRIIFSNRTMKLMLGDRNCGSPDRLYYGSDRMNVSVPSNLVSSKWSAMAGDMPDPAVADRRLQLCPVNETDRILLQWHQGEQLFK